MLRKILCILGFHTWTYNLQDAIGEFGCLPMDNKIPKTASCKYCKTKYAT